MSTTLRGTLAAAALAVVTLSSSTAGQTNGFVLQCLSARTAGAGCVTRAQTDAPTSLFRDPAGIIGARQPALEVNVAPFMPSITFENSANAGSNRGALHAYPMASFGYIGPRPSPRVAWALGMEPIGGFGSDFVLQNAVLSGSQHTPQNYESFFAAAKFGPTVAFEVTPGWSVGGSFTGLYAQIRDFRMPFSMPPSMAKGLAGIPQMDPAVYGPLFQQFTELTAYGNSHGYSGLTWGADLGVAYRAPGGFAFSASWSPERPIDVKKGVAVIDMTAQFTQIMQAMIAARMQAYGESQASAQAAVSQQLGQAGVNLQAGMQGTYTAATRITLPMTLGAGVSIPVTKPWTIGAELEWRKWSSAMQTMPFNLSSGTNGNINLMVNGATADGNFNYPFPLNWKDALSAKLGTSYQLASGNVLRAGFLYGQNPVPDNTVFVTFPAITSSAVTVGTTWSIAGFPLDVSYVHAFAHEVTGAQNNLVASEFGNSRTRMAEDVITIGRVWKF